MFRGQLYAGKLFAGALFGAPSQPQVEMPFYYGGVDHVLAKWDIIERKRKRARQIPVQTPEQIPVRTPEQIPAQIPEQIPAQIPVPVAPRVQIHVVREGQIAGRQVLQTKPSVRGYTISLPTEVESSTIDDLVEILAMTIALDE